MELEKAQLTNKFGLPRTFYKAVAMDEHEGADYSASQMTKPGQMVILENRHSGKVVEDVTERIWALFGKANHKILEEGESENSLVEQHFREKVGSVEISGISDLMEDGIVWDYKVTSAWSWVFREDKMWDFTVQLNIYAWFYRRAGFEIKKAIVVMILRDWMKSKALQSPSEYPQNQVQLIDIPLWSQEQTQEYIEKQIAYYEVLKELHDEALPPCTDAQRWAKPPKYAVKKEGVKKAYRVTDTRIQAEGWIKWKNDQEKKPTDYFIELRPGGQWVRCEYCRVQPFCHQYAAGHRKGGEV